MRKHIGLSWQKAKFVSDHFDEQKRKEWQEQTWPAILQQAKQLGAVILFADEASFAQSQPSGVHLLYAVFEGQAAYGENIREEENPQGLWSD